MAYCDDIVGGCLSDIPGATQAQVDAGNNEILTDTPAQSSSSDSQGGTDWSKIISNVAADAVAGYVASQGGAVTVSGTTVKASTPLATATQTGTNWMIIIVFGFIAFYFLYKR